MTEEERAGLELLIERRPEWQEGLESAAAVDDLLADACGSYAAAKRGLEHWRRQSGADAPDRVAEYEEHLLTIEHDIAQRLTCDRQGKGMSGATFIFQAAKRSRACRRSYSAFGHGW